MAQRTSSSGSRGTSRRVSSAPIKKPFPWGFAIGCVVLVLALGLILGFAVVNRGSGFKTALDKLDATFPGIQVTKKTSASHVASRVDYPGSATAAPDSGNHNPNPQTCAVYDAPVVNEHAVHSLEHGAVWVTYRTDLPADQVAVLKALVEGNSYRLLSPYPGQTAPVAMQSWGRRLDATSATDPMVAKFVDAYTNGPQTQEKGASCSGVDKPGTVPFTLGSDGQSFVPGGAGQPAPGAAPKAPSGAPAPVPSP